MSSEAHEPHSVHLGWWYFYFCTICEKRFALGGDFKEIPRPRACPYCGITYTQFKNEAGEFEPL